MRWIRRHDRDNIAVVDRELAKQEKKIVDWAKRVVMLEAEVDIYRPMWVNGREIKP